MGDKSRWSKSHQKNIERQKGERLKGLVRNPTVFVLGIFFTLLFNQWLVPLLPGPRAGVTVMSTQISAGNAAGCTAYSVTLVTDEAVDSTYFKIALPQNIKVMRMGVPIEKVFSGTTGDRVKADVYVVGKDSNGDCYLSQVALANDETVTSDCRFECYDG